MEQVLGPVSAVQTRQLVCEGRCNPHIVLLDYDLARIAAGDPPMNLGPVLRQARNLTHTTHQEVGGDRWRCRACGSLRRY